jgi:glycosyltransferase involved in cell wall biosynthesis
MSGLDAILVHDFAETYGGAERVLEEMALCFPRAPVYALLGRPWVAREMGIAPERFHSLLAPRERLLRHYRLGTPLFPALADAVRLPDADVVVSSSYAFAHRLRTRNDAPRVCYCHSPLRFAWTMTDRYRGRWAAGRLAERAFDGLAAAMRASDRRSAQGVTAYLTQGEYTAEQIERFYGRRAEVIGAPVNCDLFRPSGDPPGDYFLLCGRLIEPYVAAEAAIEAFRGLSQRLVVAGDGPDRERLMAKAPENVEFVGRVSDQELVELMQGCAAGLSPARHDFGLIPLEFMACGRPVIALAEGGTRGTVIPGVTGKLLASQSPAEIAAAVGSFDATGYDPAAIREHAEQWDRRAFRTRLVREVERAVERELGR